MSNIPPRGMLHSGVGWVDTIGVASGLAEITFLSLTKVTPFESLWTYSRVTRELAFGMTMSFSCWMLHSRCTFHYQISFLLNCLLIFLLLLVLATCLKTWASFIANASKVFLATSFQIVSSTSWTIFQSHQKLLLLSFWSITVLSF